MTWRRSDTSHRSAWTKAEIRAARQAPLKPLLERLGYRLSPADRDNYLVLGLASEVVIKEHYWVCLEDGSAGNAIDFLVKVQGKSFNEAMALLAS
ncbi:MAG: hypothetical protein HQ523_10895 [Lentisphaerae bacterium]|nr:hypothetical protein [Lentisphaerota bacterium]